MRTLQLTVQIDRVDPSLGEAPEVGAWQSQLRDV